MTFFSRCFVLINTSVPHCRKLRLGQRPSDWGSVPEERVVGVELVPGQEKLPAAGRRPPQHRGAARAVLHLRYRVGCSLTLAPCWKHCRETDFVPGSVRVDEHAGHIHVDRTQQPGL